MAISYVENGYYLSNKNILCISNGEQINYNDVIVIHFIEYLQNGDYCMRYHVVGSSELKHFFFNGSEFIENFTEV